MGRSKEQKADEEDVEEDLENAGKGQQNEADILMCICFARLLYGVMTRARAWVLLTCP